MAPGSKPLLFALFDIFNGDVLLPRPSWVSYEPQVIHAGKRVFWVETDEENRHTITGMLSLDLSTYSLLINFLLQKGSSLREAYEKAVTEDGDPRIMLINSPSNPTGAAFDESTVKMISKFCEDRGIVLISDEIYSDIYFEDDANISVCSGNRFNTGLKVLTGGLSKVRDGVEQFIFYHIIFTSYCLLRRILQGAGGLDLPYSHQTCLARLSKRQFLHTHLSVGQLPRLQPKQQQQSPLTLRQKWICIEDRLLACIRHAQSGYTRPCVTAALLLPLQEVLFMYTHPFILTQSN